MAGILDSKKRVIDAILTFEGRNQIARGDLRIKSYTFSDAGTYYRADIASGSADATKRIHFEASNLPQDSITLESNDEGRVSPFKNGSGIQVTDGQIVEYDSRSSATILNGTEFLFSSSILMNEPNVNFRNLQVLSTVDSIFDDSSFGVGNSNIEFQINDKRPLKKSLWSSNITHEESLFNDERLSNSLNFKYLPPINKSKVPVGTYPPWGGPSLTYSKLSEELKKFESMGYSKVVSFEPTSKLNNLFIQVFERNFDQLSKLRIIDFGRHKNSSNQVVHVFFVGKLLTDDNDNHTFSHVMTMVFQ